MATILVADDEATSRQGIVAVLQEAGHSTEDARDGAEAIELIRGRLFDVAIVDFKMPKADGLQVLQAAKTISPELPVIIVTAYGTIDLAVAAMREGAFDFIMKPLHAEEIQVKVEKALRQMELQAENIQLRKQVEEKYRMVGSSPSMKKIQREIQLVAPSHAKVLILGENGTGKELVARAIHSNSPRADRSFVKVNCAAIPEELIESELFGHERGAFTGATREKAGKFELAHRSTLLLDEVGDMSPRTQAKVLRALEEGEIQRVGGTRTIEVDVRVVAASNKDLEREIAGGRFREDLYHRLSVFILRLPPLRERSGDIPLLANYYVEKFCRENNRPRKYLNSEVMEILEKYSWPGNVRELKNVIERAVITSSGSLISALEVRSNSPQKVESKEAMEGTDLLLGEGVSLCLSEQELVRRYARMILHKNQGNKAKTCRDLGIDFKTLKKRLGG